MSDRPETYQEQLRREQGVPIDERRAKLAQHMQLVSAALDVLRESRRLGRTSLFTYVTRLLLGRLILAVGCWQLGTKPEWIRGRLVADEDTLTFASQTQAGHLITLSKERRQDPVFMASLEQIVRERGLRTEVAMADGGLVTWRLVPIPGAVPVPVGLVESLPVVDPLPVVPLVHVQETDEA